MGVVWLVLQLAEPTVLVKQVVLYSGPVLENYHLEGVIWFPFERITWAQDVNCPHWEGGRSKWLLFLVRKMLSVLSFLESKVIVKRMA
jgi:hypothetical protein